MPNLRSSLAMLHRWIVGAGFRFVLAWLLIALVVFIVVATQEMDDPFVLVALATSSASAALWKFAPLFTTAPGVAVWLANGGPGGPDAESYLSLAVLMGVLGLWRFWALRTGRMNT